MLIAAISKLPRDLIDVRHILPEWMSYLALIFKWLALFLILSLAADLVVNYLRHRRELAAARVAVKKRVRAMSAAQLRAALADILKNAEESRDFRQGLNKMSVVMRTYFEIKLRKDIEEMTAAEIKAAVSDRADLGAYFAELAAVQYRREAPARGELAALHNKAVDAARRS